MTDTAPPAVSLPVPGSATRRDQQVRDLRFLEALQATLAGCSNEQAIYGSAVHRVAAAFRAESACLAIYEPIAGRVEIVHQAGARCAWAMDVLERAVTEQHIVSAGDVLAVPIICTGGPWGALALVRRLEEGAALAFTPSERHTLRGAAERIAAELDRRHDHLLDDVLDGLLRKTKPIDVYTHTLRELRRFIRYDHSASIMTMQRGMAQMTVRVEKVLHARGRTVTLVDSPRRGRVLRLTAAQMRYLSRLEGPVELTNDGTGWTPRGYRHEESDPDGAGLWRVLCLNHGSQEETILCYPLIFGGHMLGILRLGAQRPRAFEPIDRYIRILDRFARLLSVTLYRSEMYHQSDRQLQAIKEIGRAITTPMPVEEVCERVLQLALRVLHVQVGAVGLLTKDGKLDLVAHQGCTLVEPPLLRVGEGISGTVVQSGKSWAVPDVKREPAYVVFNGRVCSELVAPITYDQEVIGFLDVESFEEGRFRTEDEAVITFLEALANQAAIAIKTAQLRDEAMERLGASMAIDPKLSMAGLQDLLIDELRNKIDQLAAANRAKSEFLAQMSHDLRGPLNVMIGLANLLTDSSVMATLSPEKQRESLEVIRSSGEVLSALIGNILDLSALEAGKVQLNLAPLDAQTAFGYLRSMAMTLAEDAGRELEVSVSADPAIAAISVDEEKFMRIMINLISNAVKFTPNGGRISVSATVDSGNDGDGEETLHLVVSDTGIGIPPEFHESVFQPFRRLEAIGSGQHHGTGLGLAVVRQLTELHGGRVWVESTPGEGSSFHVVLPYALTLPSEDRAREVATSAPAPPAPVLPAEGARSRGVVLVVEDTDDHLNLMRLAITSRGYTMHGVSSGEEALAWLASNRPDVILLDMQLPGIDGFSVAASIKGQIETHSIPLIAVTANALAINEQRALASGCDAYLTKPIDMATLLSTIDSVVSH